MGTKTLAQVFTEGWERQMGTFQMLQRDGRAQSMVSFQPTPRSFVALVLGVDALRYQWAVEVVGALERENDVVLVEPRF